MAKRSRGPSRPGQQRPTRRPQRPAGRTAAPTGTVETVRGATALTEAEEARAAELEAQIVAQERTNVAGRSRRDRGPAVLSSASRARSAETSSLLAARAAEEYAYVKRDVRRIGVVGGGMLAIMLVLFVLIEVAHVITI